MQKRKISVVISFWNEIDNLPELIERLRKVSQDATEFELFELIFVNDVSSDGSEEFLTELAKTSQDIVLVNMARRTGVSECVYAGMSVASGEAVIYLDADLQDPPEIIPVMVREWNNNEECEVVYTVRSSRKGEGRVKLAFTKFGYRFLRKLTSINLPVDAGDYKLVSRKIVDLLLKYKEHKPFMRGLISSLGYDQRPIYYNREPRGNGRQNTKFVLFSTRTIAVWLDSALISFSDVPLKAALGLGMLTSIFSGFYIIIVIVQKILGLYTPGWPALMAAILLLGSVQLMVLGIMGLYIGSIYSQTKNRPFFIIKNVIRTE
jgi:glycosyltransferase involved in cell wall biosynthesis